MSSGVYTLSERGWYPPRLSSRRRSIASFSESSTSSTRRVPASGASDPFMRVSRKFGLLGRDHPVTEVPAAEREVEGGPLAYPSLGPYPAAVAVDYPRHGRQPYARPFELVLSVQPLEGPEQLVRVRLVEAGPVVPHVVNGSEETWTRVPVGAELYARLRFPGGELPRVAEQVLERHLEQAHVSPGHEVIPDHELDLPPWL